MAEIPQFVNWVPSQRPIPPSVVEAAGGSPMSVPAAQQPGLSLQDQQALQAAFYNQPTPSVQPFARAQQQIPSNVVEAAGGAPGDVQAPPGLYPHENPNAGLTSLARAYVRPSYSPGGVGKAGEQWAQSGMTAVPGDVARPLANRYLPGEDEPTPEEMGKPIKGTDLYQVGKYRMTHDQKFDFLTNQNAQSRPHNIQPSKFDQAQGQLQETEDSALADRRLGIQSDQDRADATARSEYLFGRGLADRQLQIQDEQRRREAAIGDRLQRMDQLLDSYAQAASIDPVKKGREGRELSDSVGIALGSLGAGLTGQQNDALAIVNKRIDGEIAKQRNVVDTIGAQLTGERVALGAIQDAFMSPVAADQALRLNYLAQVEQFYRRQAATERSAAAKQNLTSVADALAAQRDQAKLNSLSAEHKALWAWRPLSGQTAMQGAHKLLTDLGFVPGTKEYRDAMINMTNKGATGFGDYASGLTNNENSGLPQTEAEVRSAHFDLGRRVNIPGMFGGGKGWAPDDTEAHLVRNGLLASQQFGDNISELRQIVTSKTRLDPMVQIRVKQIAFNNTMVLKNMHNLGVISDNEYKILSEQNGETVATVMRAAWTDRDKLLDGMETDLKRGAKKFIDRLSPDPTSGKPLQQSIRSRPVR